MPHPILTKFTLQLSSRNYATFLIVTKSIQSNSGSVLVNSTGNFTKQSIEIQSPLIPHPSILAKYLGITARKPIVIISSITGKWSSKPRIEKENISLICWITILMLLNPLTQKEVCGFYHLITWTCYVCTTRAITNHAPIGEYRLRFFPNEEFKCPCDNYPIKSRRHILYNCMRFNRYWNPRRDSLSHFIMFLTANPNAFAFLDSTLSTISSWSWN